MEIDKKTVQHIAEIARLKFTEEELEGISKDMANIISYVNELQEIDVEGVDVTVNPIYIENRLRDDSVNEYMKSDDFLMNAPEKLENYLKVPTVIGVSEDEE